MQTLWKWFCDDNLKKRGMYNSTVRDTNQYPRVSDASGQWLQYVDAEEEGKIEDESRQERGWVEKPPLAPQKKEKRTNIRMIRIESHWKFSTIRSCSACGTKVRSTDRLRVTPDCTLDDTIGGGLCPLGALMEEAGVEKQGILRGGGRLFRFGTCRLIWKNTLFEMLVGFGKN